MNAPADKVARAFGAAQAYDSHARVQREVAQALATRIAALPLPPAPRVLEIGCGTGFLTQELRRQGLRGDWLVTDLAPAMVERCRARLGDAAGLAYAVLDGERGPLPAGPFDLVCSSLALQWFDDAPAALARLGGLLAPGGHLVATTLLPGSFAEWRAAHLEEGLAPGTPAFAPLAAFEALPGAALSVAMHREDHADARAFLHALKAIGAGTAQGGRRPLTPAQLRRVMARFDQGGATVGYEVLTCHLRSAAPAL